MTGKKLFITTTIMFVLFAICTTFILTDHDPIGRMLDKLGTFEGVHIGVWAEAIFMMTSLLVINRFYIQSNKKSK